MSVRDIHMTVGSETIGWGVTWGYPEGAPGDLYKIPLYRMTVVGKKDDETESKTDFEVFRFGVLYKGGGPARSVGLAEQQTHEIRNKDMESGLYGAKRTISRKRGLASLRQLPSSRRTRRSPG